MWHKPSTEFNHQNTKAKIKYVCDGLGLYVRCSALYDVIMNKFYYLDILRQHVKKKADKFGIKDKFAEYQEKGPMHTSSIPKLWLIHNCSKFMSTPAKSATSMYWIVIGRN